MKNVPQGETQHHGLVLSVSVHVQQGEPVASPQPEGPAHLPRCGESVCLRVQDAAETGSVKTDSANGQALTLQQAGLELVSHLSSC